MQAAQRINGHVAENNDSPQALQIGCPAMSRRHRGVSWVPQLTHVWRCPSLNENSLGPRFSDSYKSPCRPFGESRSIEITVSSSLSGGVDDVRGDMDGWCMFMRGDSITIGDISTTRERPSMRKKSRLDDDGENKQRRTRKWSNCAGVDNELINKGANQISHN